MSKSVDLDEGEGLLVELMSSRYNDLVARARRILERAEGLRAGAYTAIVKRAIREKRLSSVKGLKGAPEIVREDGIAKKLVWADEETASKSRLMEETQEHKNGAVLPT